MPASVVNRQRLNTADIVSAAGGKFNTRVANIYKNEVESTLKEYVRGRDQRDIIKFLEECRKQFGIKIEKDEYKFNYNKENNGSVKDNNKLEGSSN